MSVSLNHILIGTHQLSEMIAFFENALALTLGPRPPFPFPGAWLWNDNSPIIHLTDLAAQTEAEADYLQNQTEQPACGTGILDHVAFTGTDYSQLMARLKQHGLSYFERVVPLSAERQVFVQGPEGLRIEIQFPLNSKVTA